MPNVFTFKDPTVFSDVLETVLAKHLPPKQHDRHVHDYHVIMRAYGSLVGYDRRMLELKMYREFERRVNDGEMV